MEEEEEILILSRKIQSSLSLSTFSCVDEPLQVFHQAFWRWYQVMMISIMKGFLEKTKHTQNTWLCFAWSRGT